MKVDALVQKIKELKAEGKLKDQTVEFIIGPQKFYVQNVKAGTDTMSLEVSRKQYRPLEVSDLSNYLSQAAGELETHVLNTDNNTPYKIESLFLSPLFLEITTESLS